MKPAIAILGGFMATLLAFAGGIAIAIVFLTAKPVPVQLPDSRMASTWTQEAVKVNKAAQDYERLPARLPTGEEFADNNAASARSVDTLTTAATRAEPEEKAAAPGNAAHLEWCASRYRSYNPDDNSYRTYSGVQRECVSPYSDLATAEGSSNSDPADYSILVSEAGYADDAAADTEHVQSCFARYRSYRPEDNSYQPYSGGPRRQCE
jgi:hypothetical protein